MLRRLCSAVKHFSRSVLGGGCCHPFARPGPQIRGVRDEISEQPMQILIRCDKPEHLASQLFHHEQVVEARVHADKAGLLVRTRSADGFYKLLNRIALNGVTIESVAPADDDAQSVYEYLIGTEESTK